MLGAHLNEESFTRFIRTPSNCDINSQHGRVLLVLAGLCLCICAVQSGILTGMIIPIDPNAVEFVLKSKACIDRLCSSLLILTDSIRLLKYLNTPSETCSHVY